MKKILRLSLFTLLAVLVMGVISYAATGGGKHKAKSTTAKETKKFVDDAFFLYNGTGSITSPTSWTATTSGLCPSGSDQLCGISFNSTEYPLTLGKPSSTVLNIVNSNYPHSPATNKFTVSDVTIYSKPS